METFTAVLHNEEDMYAAECPEVCTFSQGKSIEKAVNNLKEATNLYIAELPSKLKSQRLMKKNSQNTFSFL